MKAQQMTALVVDDMDAIRKITADQVRRMGIKKVLTADDGAAALKIIKDTKVDLILCDWNMPRMTGIELLGEVRGNPNWAHIPFIMVTAEAERARVAKAINSGVTDLIIKPFTPATLKDRVSSAIKGEVRNKQTSVPLEEESEQPLPLVKTKRDRDEETVLIVDDTPENLTLMAGLLKGTYRIQLAKEGKRALAICQSESPPDLVLLDIMMPGMDGFEVLKRMREHPTSEHIPVIFVTALTEDTNQEQGLRGGAVDYITKPVQPNLLKLRVRNLMRMVNFQKNLQLDIDDMIASQRLKESVEQIMRHDLKGPIAGVVAIAEQLSQGKMHPEDMREKAGTIEEMGLQLLNMVNMSAELYKIETGNFTLHAEMYSVLEMMKRMRDVLKETFKNKRLMLFLDPMEEDPGQPLEACGDPALSYSMFFNILKNACEAAPEKTRVSILLTTDEQSVSVAVQNIGMVPESIRSRFWDKFATYGKKEGTGIGTYSAKMLAEAQYAKVDMKVDTEQQTTTVTITLPKKLAIV